MKATNHPTTRLLLKAGTDSEWDNCAFAILLISEEWKKAQAKRLKALKYLEEDCHFQSVSFIDSAADFYQTNEIHVYSIEELLTGKEWVFVEMEADEQEDLIAPESRLEGFELVLYKGGNAMYKAHGRHTHEEFWTEEFALQQLLIQIA
ncbi:hypothetical protein [Emticicia sp. TH156]|uniref:hypothetical protein n=1 Tax=Emticicia sp. TH156 TaxID=2067454 RepID=UPI000C76A6C8|nr:hypothetical protein [Emticicia sp. TH156]PLK44874.1 hypothetical protein C0V77_06380 [Emticicia sp. TH156]